MRNIRQLLSFLAGELAQAHGQRFFAQLCEAVGIYLNARGVFVAGWIGPEDDRHAQTFAFWHAGRQYPNITYPLAGTPCFENRHGKICVFHKNVRTLFPSDPDVQRFQIESYVSVPFTDCGGKVVGHLALFDVQARAFPANELDAIRIASLRAGAEVQRLASERSLAEKERQYHSIVNKAGEAILLWRNGRVVDCNDTALRMFAAERDELIGKTMVDISPLMQADGSSTIERIEDLFLSARDGSSQPVPWRHCRLDGTVLDCELMVQTVVISGHEHLVTLSRDISQRLREQAALVKSESTLRAVLEHSPVAMMVCGASGEIEMVNRQFELLFGYSRSDVPTLDHWWKLAIPDVQTERRLRYEWFQRLCEAQTSGQQDCRPIETNVRCADGSTRYVQIKAVQVGERQLATMLDLTEQHEALRQAEKARRDAETASAAKDQFLAALSHELRTPLTPVLLASSHLLTLDTLPPDTRCMIEVIRRNADLEARLIDDLLDLARISSGKLQLRTQPLNIHDAISAALQICWSDIGARQLQVIQEMDADECYTDADPARLQQVFWNLLKNAVKFTPPGGRITVRTYNRPREDNSRPQLVAEVIDTGIGMTPETIAGLFTAFRQGDGDITRQFGGLGLGLSIARQVITQHGGTIEAFSDGPGTGSRFVVTLSTCAPPSEDAAAVPSDHHEVKVRQARILLVEDHKSTGQLLKTVLERFGHKVVWVQSREHAHSVIQETADFDLLVSDLGLPDGSGLEIMPVFRERTGRPGIALSGYGMEKDLLKTQEAGFAIHLIKPVDVHRLREAVCSLAGGA